MARIKLRRDTAANWTAVNPILLEGEPGLELDTGRTKHGNGTSIWTQLPYSAPAGYTGSAGNPGNVGIQGPTGFTGSNGVGFVGSQGIQGFTGSQGNTGNVGFTGSQGIPGEAADIGFTGSKGDAGGTEFVFQNVGFNYSVTGFADNTYPTLTVVRGQRYYFNFTNVTSTHPIALRLDNGNIAVVPGTIGNDSDGGVYGAGTTPTIVIYQVPFDAPSSIVYQCVVHSSMIGQINVVDQVNSSPIVGLTSNGTNTLTVGSGFNLIPETNELQDLGTSTNRFRDLYLSGNTIDLGGATISVDSGSLALPLGTKIGTVSVNFDSFENSILPPGHDMYDIGAQSAAWRYVYGAVFVGNLLQPWSPSGPLGRSVRIDRVLHKANQSAPTTPIGLGPDVGTGFLGDKLGDVTWDATYIYVCIADWDGIANIWKRISWGSDTWT